MYPTDSITASYSLIPNIRHRAKEVVGFLDGFSWVHGLSKEVVIYCIKPNLRISQRVLSGMKKRIEEILAEGKVPSQQITSRIFALING